MFKSLLTAVVASCLLIHVPSSHAQGNRPSMEPLPEVYEEGPDIGRWRDAYAKAGRPRVMVLVAEAASSVDPLDMESLVKLSDESGIAAKISSAFQEVIGDAQADAELVDRAAMVNAIKRLSANRAQAGDRDTVLLLGRELGADLAIVIKLLPTKREDADFSVTFDTRDLSRGRRGLSFPFDWKGGASVVNIKNNSRAMARKFINDFAERSVMPRRFTLHVLGLDQISEQSQAYKTLRESHEFVKTVISRGTETVPDPRNPRLTVSSAQYEVTLIDGVEADPIMVQDGIENALKRVFPGRELQTLRTERGAISVQLSSGKAALSADAAADCSVLLLEDEAGQNARRELKQLYEARNSPRIAILCNRLLTPGERRALEVKGTAGDIGNMIVIGGRDAAGVSQGSAGVTGPDSDFINPGVLEQNAREMERAISEVFNQRLGFTRIISPDVARASAAADFAKEGNLVDPAQLVAIIKRLDLADIVVLGVGRIEGFEQRYTFEAINLRDAVKVGFGDTRFNPFGRDRDVVAIMSQLRDKAKGGADAADAAAREACQISSVHINTMAGEAVAKLACSMMTNWRPPNEMDLTVTNVSDQSQLDQIVSELRKPGTPVEVIGSASFEGGSGAAGTGKFRIRYRTPSDDVPREIARLTQSLPFRLVFESKSDSASVVKIERK